MRAGADAPDIPLAKNTTRRKDLDRLRILACLSTFSYHSLQVFDFNPYYHVKSHTLSPAVDVAARLLHAVRMPLFFLIAGMVGFLALKRYSDREFVRLRAARLLPPFLVGILLLTPWVKYMEVLDGRNIDWSGEIQLGVMLPPVLTLLRRYYTQQHWFSWSHMWFLIYLFLLSCVLLPATRGIARASTLPRAPAAVWLLAPLAALLAIELILRPFFPNHVPNLIWDWASMAVYVVMLLSGAALVRWPHLERALQRGLPLAIAALCVGIALYIGVETWRLRDIGRALTLWSAICVAIGLGPFIGRGRISGESYMSEAVLPLYVMHHVPLLVLATLVKDLAWPIWQRYCVIAAGAFIITLLIYHVIVRPIPFVRGLFGLPRTNQNLGQKSPAERL